MKGISYYRDAIANGAPLSPDFVAKVVGPKVQACPQEAQVDELMAGATREDLVAVVKDLRVRLRVSVERNLALEAAIRRLVRDVFPN